MPTALDSENSWLLLCLCPMRELRDRLALVTGAASGIGRALALELADRDARLLLADIDAAGLAETAAQAQARGADVRTQVVDLADREQVLGLARLASGLPGGIDILINNAGIAYYGTTHEMTAEQLERVLAVNLLAPVVLTHELLPALLAKASSHIVNVSSVAGLVGVTRLSAYNATKFALLGFSESLRAEYSSRGLGVTTICPGLVRTRIFEVALSSPGRRAPRFPRWLTHSAERVARRAVRAIERNHGLVVVGAWPRVIWWLKRLAPSLFVRLQGIRRVRRQSSDGDAPTCQPDQRRAA